MATKTRAGPTARAASIPADAPQDPAKARTADHDEKSKGAAAHGMRTWSVAKACPERGEDRPAECGLTGCQRHDQRRSDGECGARTFFAAELLGEQADGT